MHVEVREQLSGDSSLLTRGFLRWGSGHQAGAVTNCLPLSGTNNLYFSQRVPGAALCPEAQAPGNFSRCPGIRINHCNTEHQTQAIRLQKVGAQKAAQSELNSNHMYLLLYSETYRLYVSHVCPAFFLHSIPPPAVTHYGWEETRWVVRAQPGR